MRRTVPPIVRRFLDTEAAGGVVLVFGAVIALVWANSPWRDTYETLWHTDVRLTVGTFGFAGDLHAAVNDGLMALFFLVVGLEIKRELVLGDLRDPRVAALPAIAAIGGMVVPAALYVAIAGGDGWGIPMATDIAFAVGVLALLGSRVPSTLKLFLLSLAIVDDIGAILVIAAFYSDDLDVTALLVAFGAIAAAIGLRYARVLWSPFYVALGVVCWLALHESGVHATIAGVVFGLLAPARRTARLQDLLHPVSSFVIVPVFALANAGVEIRADTFGADGAARVALGVAVGLVVGKLVGVFGATWLAVRSGVASLPEGASWQTIAGVAAVAGIGFTVSLFITDLAFDDATLADASRLAVLAASVVAAAVGAALLLGARHRAAVDPT